MLRFHFVPFSDTEIHVYENAYVIWYVELADIYYEVARICNRCIKSFIVIIVIIKVKACFRAAMQLALVPHLFHLK